MSPSKLKIQSWRQFADQVGGEFVKSFWRGSEVQVCQKQWTITLDIEGDGENSIFTRLRAPYVNKDGFRFTIYRKGFFSDLGKMLGMQDIEIGEPEFDDAFIIKGNDEFKLRNMFGDRKMRQLIEQQPKVYLTVRDDEGWSKAKFPEGVDELYFRVPGVVKDVEGQAKADTQNIFSLPCLTGGWNVRILVARIVTVQREPSHARLRQERNRR